MHRVPKAQVTAHPVRRDEGACPAENTVPCVLERRLLSFSLCLRSRRVLCDHGRPDHGVRKVGVFPLRAHQWRR